MSTFFKTDTALLVLWEYPPPRHLLQVECSFSSVFPLNPWKSYCDKRQLDLKRVGLVVTGISYNKE